MSDDVDPPGHRIEFVCTVCLASVTVLDTDPWPRCRRGHGKMEPDDPNVPQIKSRKGWRARAKARVALEATGNGTNGTGKKSGYGATS
jgi:hypothetical protein